MAIFSFNELIKITYYTFSTPKSVPLIIGFVSILQTLTLDMFLLIWIICFNHGGKNQKNGQK